MNVAVMGQTGSSMLSWFDKCNDTLDNSIDVCNGMAQFLNIFFGKGGYVDDFLKILFVNVPLWLCLAEEGLFFIVLVLEL